MHSVQRRDADDYQPENVRNDDTVEEGERLVTHAFAHTQFRTAYVHWR
jgi:hypothetical protein